MVAVLLVPLTSTTAPISFTGDLVLFAYLLGLGRFFTALAALDTGSAFEGMGAAREVTFACLAEPALFLGLLVLAKLSGSLELARMLGGTHRGRTGRQPAHRSPSFCSVGSSSCSRRIRAFHLMIPTLIWNSP